MIDNKQSCIKEKFKGIWKLAKNLFFGAIGQIIIKFIYDYFEINKLMQVYISKIMFVITAGIILGITCLIIAVFLQIKNYEWKKFPKLSKTFPLLIVAIGSMFIFGSIYIAINRNQPADFTKTINSNELWEKDRFHLPIQSVYQELYMVIHIQGENKPWQFPEIELEKLTPIEGDWIIIPEFIPTKLDIIGMQNGNAGRHYYFIEEGEFRIQEVDSTGISLNRDNQLRINFRNTTEFEGTIIFNFYGVKPKGERK